MTRNGPMSLIGPVKLSHAEYKLMKKAVMAFFFAVTTPFGIALGMALSNSYRENSPSSLITVGLLNAASAGLLIYMALVDLLAADFMGPKLQASIHLQIKSYVAVLLGAGLMSLMAKWACERVLEDKDYPSGGDKATTYRGAQT
ncbi:hypothetical protein HYC85_027088 [Camellia sinensis]|uniref:Uncharacterized protein n=1 Tax=Camellia sinensis TaxID=4442 RepID=A0A7J7G5H6_CAMSI|nr:hypothetical protein HYC85_027088 [Camellia sinensis]